eukprot:6264002-Alexandrium_andersonii.AAC.1
MSRGCCCSSLFRSQRKLSRSSLRREPTHAIAVKFFRRHLNLKPRQPGQRELASPPLAFAPRPTYL